MPRRAARPCARPGCPALALAGTATCVGHTPADSRPSASARGYGRRWQRVRALQLARSPVCADPRGRHAKRIMAASEVHHVVARQAGGSDHPSNLQSLCKSCHSHETMMERQGEGGTKSLARSWP
jgi:5-methylcytosine-specific restriction protein A